MPRPQNALDIRNLVAVAVTADLRNFKMAADQLNTTQPTLSRLVKAVETDLGAIIFRRGWSGAETTRQGDIVCQHARAIRDLLLEAEGRIFADRDRHPRFETGLSLYQLDVVEAVCRTGSATAAAAALEISQPAVSRVLNDLKAHFGLMLFSRGNRGLEPEADALDLANLRGRIATILDNLRDRLMAEHDQVAGRVAIGVLPFSGQGLISRVFARISEAHPRARLVFVPGTYPSLSRALRRGEIEGIVGIMRGETCPPDFDEARLLEESYTIVARADHPVHGRARSIADMAGEKWLVPPQGSPIRAFIERVFGQHGILPQMQTCEIQFFTAVEQMLADSSAVGIQTYSRSGLRNLRADLRKVDVPLPLEPARVGLTTLRGSQPEPAFAEFQRLLLDLAPEFA